MKQLVLLCAFCWFAIPLWAGNPLHVVKRQLEINSHPQTGSLQLTGKVIEASTKIPVGFATIALQDQAGKPLSGTNTDEHGQFRLPNVKPGAYVLAVSYIGFKTLLHPVQVTSSSGTMALGSLTLQPDQTSLQEVVVTAEKPIIQETEDGLVYNAEQDITNVGGTAADVLKNVPMLSVDMDGNVEMRGSSKVQVLINNKPSSLLASNLAEALQQIPADMIKSVEVITNPSAKYDAEGSGGVINIVLKQNAMQGLTGTVNATIGNRNNNVNTSLNGRKGKLGTRASFGGNFTDRQGGSEADQLYFTSPESNTITRQVAQTNSYENHGKSGYFQLGGDYDFNEFNNLSTGIRVNTSRSDNDRQLHTVQSNPEGFIMNQYRREINNDGNSGSLDANLNYTRKFQKKDQELEFLAIYSQNSQESDNFLNQINPEEVITYREQNDNDVRNSETTFKADYSHPLDKYGKLEVGTKITLRESSSNYLARSASSLEAPLLINPRRSNEFLYDQNVYSSYFSYTLRIQKEYIIRLGGRYEYTTVAGDFATQKTSLEKSFRNFMPNVALTWNLTEGQRLQLRYSTRIQRPQIQNLNPYRDSTNAYNVRFGNPDLDVELTHNTEVNYNWYVKSTSLNASLYWRQTNNDIGPYQTVVDSIQYTTFRNIGQNVTYGTNLSINTRFLEKGRIAFNGNLYYNKISSDFNNNERSSVLYNLSGNSSYRFPQEYSVQLNGSYNSSRITLQSRSSASFNYSLGLRKEFWNRKAGISLNLENFFQNALHVRTTVTNNNYTSYNTNNNLNRTVRLSFTYKFGKMEFKPEVIPDGAGKKG